MTAMIAEPVTAQRHPHKERRWRPNTFRLGIVRAQLEIIQFWRSRESVVFTIAFPVLMLALFGAVVRYDEIAGIPFAQYFTACMVAAGIFAASFQSLAISIAMERDKGVHRRLANTPLPMLSYLIGKACLVCVTAAVTSGLLLGVAVVGYDAHLPASLGAWFTLCGVGVLGLVACTLLGVAFSVVPRTARAAPAVVTPVALLLQLASGVFIPLSELPGWLQTSALISPLTWLTYGVQLAFDTSTTQNPGLGWIVVILGGWIVVGLVLCNRTFSWRRNS